MRLDGIECNITFSPREWGWSETDNADLAGHLNARARPNTIECVPSERSSPIIRQENRADAEEQAGIRGVNEAAFGRPDEALLVDKLRADGVVLLSLVAGLNGEIVGHILFSRMWIELSGRDLSAVALAPMAVRPDCQGRGIGSCLVRDGLERLRSESEEIVIVLGHPGYYPRFGFSTEKARLLESPFPGDAFMALELRPGALNGIQGKVRYPAAFGL